MDSSDAAPSSDRIADLVGALLDAVGEDVTRPGLAKTPQRVADSLQFLTRGYRQTPADAIGDGIFEDDAEEMVVVRDIEVYSLCEHHLLPFHGRAHVAYLPKGRIVGLSKVARLVDVFARRLQMQERLTTQIAHALHDALTPHGVAVVIEATHLCMAMRGTEKQNSRAVTSALTGGFRRDPKARAEFLELIRRM